MKERRQSDTERTERAVTTLDLVQKVWQFVRGAGAFVAATAIVGWTAAGYVYASRASDTEILNKIDNLNAVGSGAFVDFLKDEAQFRRESDDKWSKVLETLGRIDERVKGIERGMR